MLVNKDELIKQIESNDLFAFEVSLVPEISKDSIILKNKEDLIRFCKCNEIKNIFFFYLYDDEDAYIINDDLLEKIDADILELIRDEIGDYNNLVESTDFSRPVLLELFVLFEGQLIFVLEEDAFDFPDPNEKLNYLLENYKDILEQKKIKEQEKRDLLKNELQDYILNDSNFRICTNKSLRMNYAQSIIKKKEFNKYLSLFENQRLGGIDQIRVFSFVEFIWAIYRNSKKQTN